MRKTSWPRYRKIVSGMMKNRSKTKKVQHVERIEPK
jgi:hypothetical protein